MSTTAVAIVVQDNVSQCQTYLDSFNSHTATPYQMQLYARCVDLIHPAAAPDFSSLLLLKAVFIMSLMLSAACVWLFHREGWVMMGLGALIGFLLPPIAVTVVVGLYQGLKWLLS